MYGKTKRNEWNTVVAFTHEIQKPDAQFTLYDILGLSKENPTKLEEMNETLSQVLHRMFQLHNITLYI